MSTTDIALPFPSWTFARAATKVSNEGLAQGGSWHVVSLGAAILDFWRGFVLLPLQL